MPHHSLRGCRNAILFLTCDVVRAFFPRLVDLEARRRGRISECEDRPHGSLFQRIQQLMRGSHHHLESNFLLSRLQ